MHHAQVIVWGLEGAALESLRELAQGRAVWLREVSKRSACLKLMRQGGPGILVLRLGRDLEEELSLLDEVSRLFPEQATIVVSDAVHAALSGLAWDLGARYVLSPAQAPHLLREVVEGYLPEGSSANPKS
jgi:hypothetical protein